MSSIEWTDETWNPITGCKKVSPGCANCYAESIAKRFWGERKFTDVQFHPERLEQPLRWRKPRMVFVNSMSDLFHESVTDEQLDQIFAVMALTPRHTYQVLTKRPERMFDYFNWSDHDHSVHSTEIRADRIWDAAQEMDFDVEVELPLSNVWLGVTVENQATANKRIPLLLQTPAAVRFLSCEPLLEDIDLDVREVIGDEYGDGTIHLNALTGERWMRDGFEKDLDSYPAVNWVIVGGESGHNARPCDIAWIRSIVEQCKSAGVPCFVKQLGSNPHWELSSTHPNASKFGEDVDVEWLEAYPATGKGNNPDEWPEDIRVRQMPIVGVQQ